MDLRYTEVGLNLIHVQSVIRIPAGGVKKLEAGIGGSLPALAVGIDGPGLAGVVQNVALNGLASRHARSNQSTELDHV